MRHHDLPCGCNTNGHMCAEHAPQQSRNHPSVVSVAKWIIADLAALVSVGLFLASLYMWLNILHYA